MTEFLERVRALAEAGTLEGSPEDLDAPDLGGVVEIEPETEEED